MSRATAVLQEAWRSARAQLVASLATVAIIAGMCATVVVTMGRTVGAERAVLATIDAVGTRTITVRADVEAGLDTTVLDRLRHIAGIDWVGAFGPPSDVRNARIPGGRAVALRTLWGLDWSGELREGSAGASSTALDRLGMTDPAGALVGVDGTSLVDVTHVLEVPESIAFLEPLLVVQAEPTSPEPVTVLVVVAESAELVTPLGRAVESVLGSSAAMGASLESSEEMATLRGVLQSDLSSRGRELVLGVLVATAVLVASIMQSLVLLRRRDFGRRRALGASRGIIVGLVLAQTTVLSAIGAVIGNAAAAIVLVAAREPLPGADYFVALAVLATGIGAVAAVTPAVVASRRDPVVELRVP